MIGSVVVSCLNSADFRSLVMVIRVTAHVMVALVLVFVNVRVIGGVDVIMRVSIVRDEGAARFITGELDLVCIDLVERGGHRVIPDLDHGTVR